MTEEQDVYPSGPDLSGEFPPMPEYDLPPPADFDTTCRCGKELERRYATYRTRCRPFAVFACDACGHRLHLFEATRIPLILSLEDFPRSTNGPGKNRVSLMSACFSEYVDFVIEKREEKFERNRLRAENAHS
jgi:hypothetical protein